MMSTDLPEKKGKMCSLELKKISFDLTLNLN